MRRLMAALSVVVALAVGALFVAACENLTDGDGDAGVDAGNTGGLDMGALLGSCAKAGQFCAEYHGDNVSQALLQHPISDCQEEGGLWVPNGACSQTGALGFCSVQCAADPGCARDTADGGGSNIGTNQYYFNPTLAMAAKIVCTGAGKKWVDLTGGSTDGGLDLPDVGVVLTDGGYVLPDAGLAGDATGACDQAGPPHTCTQYTASAESLQYLASSCTNGQTWTAGGTCSATGRVGRCTRNIAGIVTVSSYYDATMVSAYQAACASPAVWTNN